MGMTFTEIKDRASRLPDSRTIQQKTADAQRKPAAPKPPGPVQQALEQMERAKEDRKLLRMSKEDRSAQFYRDYLESEEPKPQPPHANQAKVLPMIERIVSDEARERSAYDLAMLVYESYGPGMDWQVADELFATLKKQEADYLNGVHSANASKLADLQAQQRAIEATMGDYRDTPRPDAFGFLHRAIPTYGHEYGVTLTPQEYREIDAAAGNPEAEQAVAQKYVEKVNQYVTAVEAS